MRKSIALLFAAAVAILMPALPASAATEPIPVQSDCLNGAWYVNSDESSLLPTQEPDGLLFDGPSIVHRSADILLKDLLPGTFVAEVQTGVAPLFKVETNPYSTLNYVGDGKWWSSRIASGDQGGMSHPVTPEVMVTLPIMDKPWDEATSYSDTTKVISFGVGYANDTGNKALVKSVVFMEETYDLSCEPEEEPSPTPTVTTSASSSPSPSASETAVPPVAGGPTLPVTGVKLWHIGVAAGVLLAVGAVLVLVGVRRKEEAENS
jgi:hypothetical protein